MSEITTVGLDLAQVIPSSDGLCFPFPRVTAE